MTYEVTMRVRARQNAEDDLQSNTQLQVKAVNMWLCQLYYITATLRLVPGYPGYQKLTKRSVCTMRHIYVYF